MKRIYFFCGPSNRYDGPAARTFDALFRLPGCATFWYECNPDLPDALLGKRSLNVEVDWAADKLGYDKFILPEPSIYWASDTHIDQKSWEYRLEKCRKATTAFCGIWSDPGRMKGEGVTAKWLPYAAEPLEWKPYPDIPQDIDIGFLGHFGSTPKRIDLLDKVFHAIDNFDCDSHIYEEEAVKRMARYKIILNECAVDSTNQRVFEAMAMGGCLLTPATSDLEWLGIHDEEHCLTYRTPEEAIAKARAWIPRENGRRAMGERARALILDRHTYIHRALDMLGCQAPDDLRDLINTNPADAFNSRKGPKMMFVPVLRENL